MTQLDTTFAALGDPTRREIVAMLAQQPLSAGEIGAAFDVSTPAISRHLRVLRHAGLVEDGRATQDSRVRMYQLREEPLLAVEDWVTELKRFWGDQLAAFKAHAEARTRKPHGDSGRTR